MIPNLHPTIPTTQRAIVCGPDSSEFIISNSVPVITLEPDAILIRNHAVALNPADTKMLGPFLCPGAIYGFDCAGTVLAIGTAVRKSFSIGDRVCGSADGMSRHRPLGGAFAEYVSLPGDMALKIPDGMSFEEAAALGTAMASAGLALFWSLGISKELLVTPAKEPWPVLVNGGSTSTGTMAIQLLKVCNLIPITTSSQRSFPLLKSLGVDSSSLYDYNIPSCAASIKSATTSTLAYALDCITIDSTISLCYASIGRRGGRYTALDPYPERLATRKVVKPDWILATRITGRGSSWPEPYGSEPDEEMKRFAEPFFAIMQDLLDKGRIRPHPVRVIEGGFEALIKGVGIIRRGEVSGEKLIYRVADRV